MCSLFFVVAAGGTKGERGVGREKGREGKRVKGEPAGPRGKEKKKGKKTGFAR